MLDLVLGIHKKTSYVAFKTYRVPDLSKTVKMPFRTYVLYVTLLWCRRREELVVPFSDCLLDKCCIFRGGMIVEVIQE